MWEVAQATGSSLVDVVVEASASTIAAKTLVVGEAAPSVWTDNPHLVLVVSYLLFVWTMGCKGYGLWVAAGKKQPFWFILMFLSNTMGLLELVYIFYLSKYSWQELISKLPFPVFKKSGTDGKKEGSKQT